MLKNYEELSPEAIDCLREIGNIGSSYAAGALSQMLGKSVSMNVPDVKVVEYQSVIDEMGGPEKIITGILVLLNGDIEGMFMFLLEDDFAKITLSTFLGKQNINVTELDENDYSVIREMGSIMSGSYLGALSQLTDMKINMSVPSMTVDMMGAIMNAPMIAFSDVGDKALFINNGFVIDGVKIKSNITLIPTVQSLDILMKKLGVIQ